MTEESIWHARPTPEEMNQFHEGCGVAHAGIEFIEVGDRHVRARMPVDKRTNQPFGLFAGGSAVLLLETLASAAANYCVDLDTHICVGLEINCNHIRAVTGGWVYGRAEAVHMGRTSMVWELRNEDEQGRLVTMGRITIAVVQRR